MQAFDNARIFVGCIMKTTDGYLDTWSVEIHNPHARNRKTYHAGEIMIRRECFHNSIMRYMVFRQDYATYVGAIVTFHDFGHHVFLVSCGCMFPQDGPVALLR